MNATTESGKLTPTFARKCAVVLTPRVYDTVGNGPSYLGRCGHRVPEGFTLFRVNGSLKIRPNVGGLSAEQSQRGEWCGYDDIRGMLRLFGIDC